MNFGSIEKYVDDKSQLITGNEQSKKQNDIPELIGQYGGGVIAGLKSRKHVLNKMISCMYHAKESARSIRKNPVKAKTTISDEDFIKLENYVKSIGIADIGYTKVDRKHIFKDKSILFDQAIVLVIEMEHDSIKSAPSKLAVKEIFRTYNELGIAVNKISKFLRSMGYNAMAGPAIGGAANYVPMAQDAGLGCIGKHGLLISDHDFGPSLRLAAVYTDIENLPLAKENPHLWVREFCDKCNKCVKNCPAGAIYNYTIDDKKETSIDYTKCATPFANDYGCTVCVKSCTFFNSEYEKVKAGYMKMKDKEDNNLGSETINNSNRNVIAGEKEEDHE